MSKIKSGGNGIGDSVIAKVQSAKRRVQSAEYKVQSAKYRVQSAKRRVQSAKCRAQDAHEDAEFRTLKDRQQDGVNAKSRFASMFCTLYFVLCTNF